ncbi:MAG: TonB family protein, partial [Myxococcales bacterium]
MPPRAVHAPPIAFPAGAPPIDAPVEVRVHVRIDVTGQVADVEVVQGAREDLDRAVVEAVKAYRFEPATLGGRPLEVVLPFTHTFVPPPPPVEEGAAPELDAILEGVAIVMGTRQPVANATVYAKGEDGEWLTTTDAQGNFKLPVKSGELEVRIVADGHKKFLQKERLPPNLRLRVKYLVERESYGMYQSITRAERDRTEVSRTTLSGRELTRVPGTFGDPYRAMLVLPGVTTVMGLLPLPIVRGSSPGNTGVMLDGVRLPLLFHLLAGPSVVHPEFIDHVDFYPGGFPVQYGGYTGGIVDGVTRRTRSEESRLDLDLNLVQSGVFARHAVEPLDMTASVAGRIGYPGVLLSLATPDVNLNYWDYQARFDFGPAERSWSVFFYGAEDHLKVRQAPGEDLKTALRFTFHRLDLRHRVGPDDNNALFRVVFGYDDSQVGGGDGVTSDGAATDSWAIIPQVRWHRAFGQTLELNTGVDGQLRRVKTPALAAPG